MRFIVRSVHRIVQAICFFSA